MGWFFGCFGGGSSKKDRKHHTPPPRFSKHQQKPACSLPVHLSPATSSLAIPIKAIHVPDVPNREDLFTVCPVSSSAPVGQARGILLSESSGRQTPEKSYKLGMSHPWSQLDDLEEELEDLRKQIDRDTQDAKTIKDEFGFVKSCGALVKSPAELKKGLSPDQPQRSVPDGGWRSWLLPPSSPPASGTLREKHSQNEGLKAILHHLSPTKECSGALHGVQTPDLSTKVTQSVLQSSQLGSCKLQHTHEEHVDGLKEGGSCDFLINHEREWKLSSDAHLNSQSSMVPLNGSSASFGNQNPLNSMPDSLLKVASHSKQASKSLLSPKKVTYDAACELDSGATKKRRLMVKALSPATYSKPTEVNGMSAGDASLCQKRLKVVSSITADKDKETVSLVRADPVPMHFFRCDSLSPINEADAFDEDLYTSTRSPSQESPSSSTRQSPASPSQTKSVSFASTHDGGYNSDVLSPSINTAKKHSFESSINSTHINDRIKEDDVETASYSSSFDSEETLSDLSPEHCFSPPISPNNGKSSAPSKHRDISTTTYEAKASHDNRTAFNHFSTSYGGGKNRYDIDDDDKTEDDYDLYADAMSHVSTECSEREHRKWHGRTDSMDSISVQFAQRHSTTEMSSIATPAKLTDQMVTPNINIPGMTGKHTSRLRNRPTSSVLTPVENVSQWQQLKTSGHKPKTPPKKCNNGLIKEANLGHVKYVFGNKAADAPIKGDENRHESRYCPRGDSSHATIEAPVSVNASFSQCGKPLESETIHVNTSLSSWASAPNTSAMHVDASFSEWSSKTTNAEPIRTDMSLSQWLNPSSKNDKDRKSSGTSTSSSDGISPAPEVKNYKSTSPIMGMQGVPSSAVGGPKQQSPWDGKGTTNVTAKYKEDQKVSWHAASFEQRLEKALDKQGMLLQKRIFEVAPMGF